jgi:hypothetical protein
MPLAHGCRVCYKVDIVCRLLILACLARKASRASFAGGSIMCGPAWRSPRRSGARDPRRPSSTGKSGEPPAVLGAFCTASLALTTEAKRCCGVMVWSDEAAGDMVGVLDTFTSWLPESTRETGKLKCCLEVLLLSNLGEDSK